VIVFLRDEGVTETPLTVWDRGRVSDGAVKHAETADQL
jgi:hypothetical protein